GPTGRRSGDAAGADSGQARVPIIADTRGRRGGVIAGIFLPGPASLSLAPPTRQVRRGPAGPAGETPPRAAAAAVACRHAAVPRCGAAGPLGRREGAGPAGGAGEDL